MCETLSPLLLVATEGHCKAPGGRFFLKRWLFVQGKLAGKFRGGMELEKNSHKLPSLVIREQGDREAGSSRTQHPSGTR